MQNVQARAATGERKFDCITPILKQLQWLPVTWQLVVRDAVMSFKCLHGLATAYLCSKFIVLDRETSWMYRCPDQLLASSRLYTEPLSFGMNNTSDSNKCE